MADVSVHLRRNLERYEREGDAERVKAIKARLAENDAPELSMLNSKAELLEAAEGLDVDESNTKAEILEALEG